MATLILNHKVKDFTSWKALYDSDKERRSGAGMVELAVGEKAGEPGNVFVIWQLEDVSIVEKMLSDPELQARMAEGGVISKPEVTILN